MDKDLGFGGLKGGCNPKGDSMRHILGCLEVPINNMQALMDHVVQKGRAF